MVLILRTSAFQSGLPSLLHSENAERRATEPSCRAALSETEHMLRFENRRLWLYSRFASIIDSLRSRRHHYINSCSFLRELGCSSGVISS